MGNQLIYDIGMHQAADTEFYLKKGFRVVAVDANPDLCARAIDKFADEIENGRLLVVNVGIAEDYDELPFTVNKLKDDWSSFVPQLGQRIPTGHNSVETEVITVKCMPFDAIIDKYGPVYYVKVEIEGHDDVCFLRLERMTVHPKYFSVEGTVPNFARRMEKLGYTRFKLISQVWHNHLPPICPPMEGAYADVSFTGHHSGPFGAETYGDWLSATEFEAELACISRQDWHASRHRTWGVPEDVFNGSWWDYHAALPD